MSRHWPKVRLGEVLRHTPRPLSPELGREYREIGIRSHGRGIFHKPPVPGAEIGDKRVFRIEPGDFVLNIVFAWEGAVAIAGPAEEGMIGSHRFPTFRTVQELLDPAFLLLYFRTPAGLEMLGRVSPGGAGRNRTLNRAAFLNQEIPLPPLAEQHRIVARIEELAAQIHEARALRQQAGSETEALRAAQTNSIFSKAMFEKWPHRRLEEVAEIRSGVTLGRQLAGRTVKLPYLRVANVQDGHLNLREVKEVEVLETEFTKWQLLDGDLLLTEGGDWDKLGRGTVWRNEIPHCIHQNHIFRVRTRGDEFVPEFLAALIGSPVGKAYFQEASKQTTNLASINQRQLKAFMVVQPPISEQRRIVAELDALQAEVDTLKHHQADTAAELDALLPAILDRAFRGEL